MTDLIILKSLSRAIIQYFRSLSSEEFWHMVEVQEYHGFGKSRLPEQFLQELLDPYNLVPKDVQIELVKVATDLTHEVHYHQRTFAFCTILGSSEHVDPPRAARAFLNDKWSDVTIGQEIEIPAGVLHGFTVDTQHNGILYFLSVQAPPIVRGDGDDYHHPNKT